MKKILTTIMTITMVFSAVACGRVNEKDGALMASTNNDHHQYWVVYNYDNNHNVDYCYVEENNVAVTQHINENQAAKVLMKMYTVHHSTWNEFEVIRGLR